MIDDLTWTEIWAAWRPLAYALAVASVLWLAYCLGRRDGRRAYLTDPTIPPAPAVPEEYRRGVLCVSVPLRVLETMLDRDDDEREGLH